MEAPESHSWSDLLAELLGLVLSRLPSLADRVHLRKVCHPWRSGSLLQPLPVPFPWLTLPDGTFFSIPGGEVHRMPVPDGATCYGSIDNCLFLASSDGTCTLMNPFSKSTLELPNLVTVWKRELDYNSDRKQLLYKLVAPSPLDLSPDSLVTALIMDDGNNSTLCISQPPNATDWVRGSRQRLEHLFDIAFFNGKLYGASVSGKLFILEFCSNHASNLNIKCVIESFGDCPGRPKCIPKDVVSTWYLVECGGRLLVVKRFIRCRTGDNIFDYTQTVGFVVLEADLDSNPCQWRRIIELGGHALFLGHHGSKSLPATECSGSQEDCIYFIFDYSRQFSLSPFHDSGVYNMRNGRITPLISETAAPAHDAGQWRPTWLFHAGAV